MGHQFNKNLTRRFSNLGCAKKSDQSFGSFRNLHVRGAVRLFFLSSYIHIVDSFFEEAMIRTMRHRAPASETHMTKPMTDDASHPLAAANFCLFASPSPSINGPGLFVKTEETMGKEMFSRSRILFFIRDHFPSIFCHSSPKTRCFSRKGGSFSRRLLT